MAYIVCYFKFKKEVATHAIASKLWTLTLFGLIIQLTMTCHSGILFQICLYAGIVSRLEIIAILISLKEWTPDVPSLYHALQLRKGKPITRHKLFNG
jgi:CDP-diacylglycerol--glycerol-3-phosphate 3-phosphatidyltransferase